MIKKPLFKRSMKLYLILIITGTVLSAAGAITYATGHFSRVAEFGAGLGSAAIFLGSIGMIALRKKPCDARQAKIDIYDERNIKIREKSAHDTFYITLIALAASQLAFVFLDQIVPCFIVLGVMAVHVISYFIMLSYNNKKL